MHVALVVERFDPRGGGLEQWAWQLSHALVHRGRALTVVAFHVATQTPAEGIHVHCMPWHADRITRAETAAAALAAIDADVVHDLGVGWSADVLHPQMGCRLAAHARGERARTAAARAWRRARPSERRWLRAVGELERRQDRSAAPLIVAVSHMVAADLAAWHDVDPARVRLVPNGVDLSRFAGAAAASGADIRRRFALDDAPVFLFAARNPRLKGLAPLLRAWAVARRTRPDLRLVVIGSDPPPEFVRLATRLGVSSSVIFAGACPNAAPFFAAANAFVLPTYYDACSVSVLEACASGLPIVTTRDNGVSDLLVDGREGRIIDRADDVPALADSILQVADPARSAAMGAAAHETAVRCGFDANVAALERVYAEALKRRQAERRPA